MSRTTTIHITRHGQTEWNTLKKFQGHNDSPLTELGVKQAEWLGESLRNTAFDRVYSSSSPRAFRTAEIVAGGRGIPIEACDEFMEINLGIWEGMDQGEAERSYPEQFHNFWKDPEAFRVPDGETFRDVSERAIRKLLQIVAENAGQSILVVTHTVVVKLIMAYFEQRDWKDLWNLPYIHPTCLCKVEVNDDGHAIILHGDISHYREAATES
ncbi:histidine phosphatase family protein [Cohnella panacarvi]|uniref:histidine phosphatase family protein n=1 Tax=Cohnella panacarvi TaxID=400776 RepID=UPI00047ED145|nr:histidine phosphatase family protein [Cohnella panacarvi]